jgi:hypothetical protein
LFGAEEHFMSIKLTITQKPTYLHIIVTGQLSEENVLRYFEEIHRGCTARNCFRILIEENLDGPRLDVVKVLKLISEESSKSVGLFKAIAYVDVNSVSNSMEFIEDAAVNRRLPVKVFPTAVDAEKWLLNKVC